MSIRMRHTRGHTGNRRSHHALKAMKIITDASSGALRLPHRVDETTGTYRGKQIFTPKVKAKKAEHKHAHSHAHEHEHAHEHAQHEHANAETKGGKGVLGKIGIGRPKARSGMGGQAS